MGVINTPHRVRAVVSVQKYNYILYILLNIHKMWK